MERDFGEGGSSAGVVDDVLDDTFDEAVSFGEVHASVLGRSLAGARDRFEDAAGTFTTGSDDASHL